MQMAFVNRAEPWWVQGDKGDTASAGGWVRVFGITMAAPSDEVIA
jgi:hypothetical protein